MLKEFLEFLSQQAVAAGGARVVEVPEPAHCYVLQHPDGRLETVDADPEPRQHAAGDLDTVVAWALARAGHAAVWYSRKAVVCLLDDATRRDKVTLPLALSVPMQLLGQLEQSHQGYDPRRLAKMLRTTFEGCLGGSDGLPKALDGIKFESGQVVSVSATRDKSSLGREVREQVSGVVLLPPQVTLAVPVFVGPCSELRREVRCALEPDTAAAQVQLIPLPGQVEQAVRSAEDAVGEQLVAALGDKVPCYYGSP